MNETQEDKLTTKDIQSSPELKTSGAILCCAHEDIRQKVTAGLSLYGKYSHRLEETISILVGKTATEPILVHLIGQGELLCERSQWQ